MLFAAGLRSAGLVPKGSLGMVSSKQPRLVVGPAGTRSPDGLLERHSRGDVRAPARLIVGLAPASFEIRKSIDKAGVPFRGGRPFFMGETDRTSQPRLLLRATRQLLVRPGRLDELQRPVRRRRSTRYLQFLSPSWERVRGPNGAFGKVLGSLPQLGLKLTLTALIPDSGEAAHRVLPIQNKESSL